MTEKLVTDAAVKTARRVEKGAETAIKKAWSVLDAASEKRQPSQFLGDKAIKAIQGQT